MIYEEFYKLLDSFKSEPCGFCLTGYSDKEFECFKIVVKNALDIMEKLYEKDSFKNF